MRSMAVNTNGRFLNAISKSKRVNTVMCLLKLVLVTAFTNLILL